MYTNVSITGEMFVTDAGPCKAHATWKRSAYKCICDPGYESENAFKYPCTGTKKLGLA